MDEAPVRLSKQMLNKLFIEGLGNNVKKQNGVNPLLVDLTPPFPLRLRVYLYNLTNPPGGRKPDEYKFQIILPGQPRGARGTLDWSDGRMPVLAAYARMADEVKGGVFVLWDPYKHLEFAYSANVQAHADTIVRALYESVALSRRSNGEVILAARPEHLIEALRMRVAITLEEVKRQ